MIDDAYIIQVALWAIVGLLGLLCSLLIYVWNERKRIYYSDRKEQKDFNAMIAKELTAVKMDIVHIKTKIKG